MHIGILQNTWRRIKKANSSLEIFAHISLQEMSSELGFRKIAKQTSLQGWKMSLQDQRPLMIKQGPCN